MIALPDGAKLRRTWPQRLLLGVNVVVVVLCLATAGALAYVDNKVGRVRYISLGQLTTEEEDPDAGGVKNILLTGVDNQEGLDPEDPRMEGRDDGLRSDTIMLLRVDPEREKAALVSFPRDLWLPLGGDGQRSKINSALPIGGPDLLIRTISENFGIPINHYVQVNFAQFQRVVDVIGGVPVPFDKPVRDEWTGLEILEPGCTNLDGKRALDYVRSRYLEYYDGDRWQSDPAVRPVPHRPPAGLHPPGPQAGRVPGLPEPDHARPAAQRRPRLGDRGRRAVGVRHRVAGPALPQLRPRPLRDLRPAGGGRLGR